MILKRLSLLFLPLMLAWPTGASAISPQEGLARAQRLLAPKIEGVLKQLAPLAHKSKPLSAWNTKAGQPRLLTLHRMDPVSMLTPRLVLNVDKAGTLHLSMGENHAPVTIFQALIALPGGTLPRALESLAQITGKRVDLTKIVQQERLIRRFKIKDTLQGLGIAPNEVSRSKVEQILAKGLKITSTHIGSGSIGFSLSPLDRVPTSTIKILEIEKGGHLNTRIVEDSQIGERQISAIAVTKEGAQTSFPRVDLHKAVQRALAE